METRSAIGIVRVSVKGEREGESFVSPRDQRRRIEEVCEREGLALRSVAEEIDVSGGKPLDQRDGLNEAVAEIEAGRVQVVVVAYFDRFFRSLEVQREVVSRVEAAGGMLLAVDFGQVSEATATQWLSGTIMGTFAEFYRRSAKERTRAGQVDAVERGVVPYPSLPPGLERTDDKRVRPSALAPLALLAYELRAEGATIETIREELRGKGLDLSYRSVQGLLKNRLLKGELRFGDLRNANAYDPPVVPVELWNRVQRVRVSRGRRPQSDRLLARLGVLRCGTCGGRMVVGTHKERRKAYAFYRCASFKGCEQRMAIGAEIAEAAVTEAVKDALSHVEERASVETNAREAERVAEVAQEKLDSAFRAFSDFSDEPAAQETLVKLRDERDRSLKAVEQLGRKVASEGVTAADWDKLLMAGKRDLILATIERVDVLPGKGRDRLRIQPLV